MRRFKLFSLPITALVITVIILTIGISGFILVNATEGSVEATHLNLLRNKLLIISVGIIALLATLYMYWTNHICKPLENISQAIENNSIKTVLKELANSSLPQFKTLASSIKSLQKELHNTQQLAKTNYLHDSLTGLPSRFVFSDHLKLTIKEYKRKKATLALLCLDLNRFKEINDSLGHDMGDNILKDVSGRLSNLLREMDTIARLGDDEFAILIKDANLQAAQTVAEKIVNSFSMPFCVDHHQLLISPSIGVALYPEHAEDAPDLISKANHAMSLAKSDHLGYSIFDPKKVKNRVVDLTLSSELRKALNENQLQLFYQPKYCFDNNKVVEVEALLRWIHPERGFIPPDQIIHAAEGSGLIHPLTEWIVGTAIKKQKEWEIKEIDVGIAVNLSVYDLHNPHLISIIQYLMMESKTKAGKLILEITEGAMMRNPELARDVLLTLDKMNIKIAIDDFGTGYSSLAYLKNLPVDELKIDRSFVMNLKDDEKDLAIVRSTIDLAHNLNLRVVAEGVENQESWDKLEELGCDLIQGFYLSKPQPAVEFENWYREYHQSNQQSA